MTRAAVRAVSENRWYEQQAIRGADVHAQILRRRDQQVRASPVSSIAVLTVHTQPLPCFPVE